MHVVSHHIQSEILREILGNVADGFFCNFIAFAWNVIKHAVCKDIDGFLKLIAEVIQVFNILQGHQKLVVDF